MIPENFDSTTVTDETTDHRNEMIEKLTQFIVDNEIVMLGTCDGERVVRSRPLINPNRVFNGDLFFIIDKDDEIGAAITANPQVNVAISEPSGGRFASITGHASVSLDCKKAELIWNDNCTKYFGMNRPDDSLRILCVDVKDAEYWDRNQSLSHRMTNFVRGIAGSSPVPMQVDHEQVNWPA